MRRLGRRTAAAPRAEAVWEESARYCPLCGVELEGVRLGGRARRRCPSCEFVLYRNPASAALGVVLDARARILLVRRSIEPYRGCWALPAGYQEADESPEATVVREVREETGIEVAALGLLDVCFVPDDPRKPANVVVFLCRATGGSLAPGREESDVGWFDLERLPEPIGFDNVTRILARLRGRDGYPDSPWSLLRGLLADRGDG